MKEDNLYLVGRYLEEPDFEIIGIFSTKGKAEENCIKVYDFVMPFELNKNYGNETVECGYFPNAGETEADHDKIIEEFEQFSKKCSNVLDKTGINIEDASSNTDNAKTINKDETNTIGYLVIPSQVTVHCGNSLCCNWHDDHCNRSHITVGRAGRCESFNTPEEDIVSMSATINMDEE